MYVYNLQYIYIYSTQTVVNPYIDMYKVHDACILFVCSSFVNILLVIRCDQCFFHIHFGDTSQLQSFWCLGVKDRPGPLSCGASCGDGQGVTWDLLNILAIEMTEEEFLCLK